MIKGLNNVLLKYAGLNMWGIADFRHLHVPRFRCATLDCSYHTTWFPHWWRGANQDTWSGKRLSRTMVWAMVVIRSDQRAKSHYSLIINRTKMWIMVALSTDQRAKSHYSLIISRTKV